MKLSISFESSIPRKAVALHAWEPAGRVWDIVSTPDSDGRFQFTLVEEIRDARQIHFKYRFPYEHEWESDAFVRRVPTRRATSFWTFDQSPRTTIRDPYVGVTPAQITFSLLTSSRYRGGRLLIWTPTTSDRLEVPQTSRDEKERYSIFVLSVADWMKRGFHFKWITAYGQCEDERYNRVWRPTDGNHVFVKSGQVSVHAIAPRSKTITIKALYPASLREPPTLKLADEFDDFAQTLSSVSPASPLAQDPRFSEAKYTADVYPSSPYWVSVTGPPLKETPRLPIRISGEDEGAALEFTLLLGASNWLSHTLALAPVRFVFAPQRDSASKTGLSKIKSLKFDVGVDAAPPYETLTAVSQSDGTWSTETRAPVGVSLYATPVGEPDIDQRADGPISSRRVFVLTDEKPVQLSTAGGVGGFMKSQLPPIERLPPAQSTPQAPPAARAEVSLAEAADSVVSPAVGEPPPGRLAMMAASFGQRIANAGVFDPDELPLGPTPVGSDVFFVIVAPHAMDLQLVFLSESNVRTTYPMTRTADNRYFWRSMPATQVPHGQRYRFLQNNNLEVLDPGARWAIDPSNDLITNVGDGINAAWSLYADPAIVAASLKNDFWPTQPWQTLLVYKLHAQRFTNRNSGVAVGFDQVTAELAPGKYLHNLGVTALEFLPLAEFDTGSWGYNPSLFFAIQSRYGGPEALARCAAAAHSASKGLMMDLVFNHYFHCPLEALASDVYIDGMTGWGNMVNFDNPICMQFFRQALIYLWNTFRLDGFRFDCTLAMAVETGTWPGVVTSPGSGGGRNFLNYLRAAVRRCADVTGRRWPYFDGENDPNMWDLTNASFGGVLDGQWDFAESYSLGEAARNQGDDQSYGIRDALGIPITWGRPFSEAVRFGESQDTCGDRGWGQIRLVRRAPFGQGFQMAKGIGTIVLLADGVPMLFQGQEGGEDNDFFFDFLAADLNDPTFYARLDLYERLGDDHNRIFAWFRDLIGLRNNSSNGMQGDDYELTGRGYKTIGFTRSYNRFFVVASFGTTDNRQTLSWLGLPLGSQYKEIFNSSWPAYQVVNEYNYTNGGYDAILTADSVINVPPIGGIVLERR